VPDGHQVPRTDEDVGFAELETVRRELGRPQDDEQRVFVSLELRPLVCGTRVFNREVVQTELPLDFFEDRRVRFVETDPDELPRLLERLAGVFQCEPADAATAGVRGAVDDARRLQAADALAIG
jgi:hypothetical protein